MGVSEALEQIINDKKNRAESEIIEQNTKDLFETLKERTLSEQEIKEFLEYMVRAVRQIERML